MEVKCYNQKCLNEWTYRGKSKGYITCSKCHYRIKLDKSIVYYSNSKTKEIPKSTHSLTALTHLQKKEEYERVYFPDGFNCLVQEDIVPQFKELVLKDLQEEVEPVVEFIKEVDGIREIKKDLDIRIIPRDPIKLLEHQQRYGFFGF